MTETVREEIEAAIRRCLERLSQIAAERHTIMRQQVTNEAQERFAEAERARRFVELLLFFVSGDEA